MAARIDKSSSPALRVTAGRSQSATCQTRISDFAGLDRPAGDRLLSAHADLYCRIQRKLFAEVSAGRSTASMKGEYLQRYRIPARMFNAVRVSLEGKVASVREQQLMRRDELQRRIARAKGQIAGASPGASAETGQEWLHQKRRRLGNLKARLEKLEADIESDMESGRIRLCFGSKRLWRKQYALGPTAIPIMLSGSGTGALPAAMSSSCWEAGTRRPAASCVWPRLMMTVPLPFGSGSLAAWRERRASTWSFRGPFQLRPRAGAGGPGQQRRVL